MNRKKSFFLLTAGLFLSLGILYILWPAKPIAVVEADATREAAFLDSDPRWADSLLRTMTTEEQLAQLFFPRIPLHTIAADDSFSFAENIPVPGGIVFSGHLPEKQLQVTAAVLRQQSIPLLLANDSPTFLASPSGQPGADDAVFHTADTAFIRRFATHSSRMAAGMGLDLLFMPATEQTHPALSEAVLQTMLKSTNTAHQLTVAGRMQRTYDFEKDSLYNRDSLLAPFQALADSGWTILEADSTLFINKKSNQPSLRDFCEDELDFRGLLLAQFPEGKQDPRALLKLYFDEGVEMFVTGSDHFRVFSLALEMMKAGVLSEGEVNRRCRKILLAKSWVRKKNYRKAEDLVTENEWNIPFTKVFNQQSEEKRVVLLHNRSTRFPLVVDADREILLIEVGEKSQDLIREIRKYAGAKHIQAVNLEELKKIKTENFRRYSAVVLFFNRFTLVKEEVAEIRHLLEWKDLVVLHSGHSSQLPFFSGVACLLHSPGEGPLAIAALGNALIGSEQICGRLAQNTGKWKAGHGVSMKAQRLKFARPEECGISSDSLLEASQIMEEAIRNRALPGGQVLFAVEGKIIYHKTFGYHTYKKDVPVKKEHLYDMASVTKVAATTLMAMHFYEKKKFDLDDSLYRYLPDSLTGCLGGRSTLGHVTFREILIHASGLPAGQNILRFMRFDEEFSPFDLYFCDEKSPQFDLVCADSFYLDRDCLDTLWLDLNKIWLNPDKPYCYSDANMNLLYTLLRPYTGKQRWEKYVDSVFYHPLGMHHTMFIPLQQDVKKEMIAPTENDRYWRKQVLQGHVHDPTAALYGGVAGNAGLFSNAYDMAVLFQMLLNGGRYGGKQFFDKETVDMFTRRQNGTHRALGFNMQVSGNTYGCSLRASERTFGHTGFTGTAVWADPQHKTISVFISNRVHPDPENKKIIQLGITRRVHDVLYRAMGLYSE